MTIAVYREADRRWVSKCEELDIASDETTFEKPLHNIKAATEVSVEIIEDARASSIASSCVMKSI